MSVHISVMVREVLQLLGPVTTLGPLVDATTGEGGHSEALLKVYPEAVLYCWDTDHTILDRARQRLSWADERVQFAVGWYDELALTLEEDVGGFLFDLGVSLYHFTLAGRGFSFQRDEPLDMRLGEAETTAEELVNTLSERELAALIRKYGEEKKAAVIARNIVRHRPLSSSAQLARVIAAAVGRQGRIHPATRTFQALRIAVNDELGRLQRALEAARERLKPGGRMVVLTYHSLEDRLVKHTFAAWCRSCTCSPEARRCSCAGQPAFVNLGRFFPTAEEVRANPSSRSAVLRAVRRSFEGEEAQ